MLARPTSLSDFAWPSQSADSKESGNKPSHKHVNGAIAIVVVVFVVFCCLYYWSLAKDRKRELELETSQRATSGSQALALAGNSQGATTKISIMNTRTGALKSLPSRVRARIIHRINVCRAARPYRRKGGRRLEGQ